MVHEQRFRILQIHGLGRITPSGQVTVFPLPSGVLPAGSLPVRTARSGSPTGLRCGTDQSGRSRANGDPGVRPPSGRTREGRWSPSWAPAFSPGRRSRSVVSPRPALRSWIRRRSPRRPDLTSPGRWTPAGHESRRPTPDAPREALLRPSSEHVAILPADALPDPRHAEPERSPRRARARRKRRAADVRSGRKLRRAGGREDGLGERYR